MSGEDKGYREQETAVDYIRRIESFHVIPLIGRVEAQRSTNTEHKIPESTSIHIDNRPVDVGVRPDWHLRVVGYVGALVSIGTLILLGFTVHWTKQQWVTMNQTLGEIQNQTPLIRQSADAARSSADLTRQIAESNQAASVEPSFPLERTVGDRDLIVRFRLENSGITSARDVRGDFSVSSVRLPTGTVVPAQIVRLEKSQMPTHDSVDKELVFPGLTRVFLGQGTTSIKIEGHFTYDNGFGHKNRGSTCQQFMRVATVSNPGGRLWGESFVQCDKVAETESTNAYYADEINKSKK